MNFKEYFEIVLKTVREDWNVICRFPTASGSDYPSDKPTDLVPEEHRYVAALKSNLSIGIAWGMNSIMEMNEHWKNKFPEASFQVFYLDFFYNGSLVYREPVISLFDGNIIYLPAPDNFETLSVPRNKSRVFHLLNSFYLQAYEEYFQRAGYGLNDYNWPL